jgi:penicillin-binding protein 1C
LDSKLSMARDDQATNAGGFCRLLSGKPGRFVVRTLLVCGLIALGGWLALRLVPLPPTLLVKQVPELEFLDRAGQPLRVVRQDGGPFRRPTAYGEIPLPLIQATLAAEDRRFWQHAGVDWRATARAAWQWVRHRRVISGGSTITRQLIKLWEPHPRCLRTKLIEAMKAVRLEQVWHKQRILAAYLNRLDYGNFNCGCAAAADFYFAKPLRDLSPAECAVLAALPQALSRRNPHAHLDRAVKRQQGILGQMQQSGWLTQAEYQRAAREPLRLAGTRRVFEAPHFVDLLLRLQESSGTWSAAQSPAIRTTLDAPLTRFAEAALRQHLSRLKAQRMSDGAIVVLDNPTGDVLALVGSENYFAPEAGRVNGAWALRSPGSTLKPFTYLLAFGSGATPASIVADVPTEFPTASGLFAPVNYDRHCYGPMRYRLALANSRNISAVKVPATLGGRSL